MQRHVFARRSNWKQLGELLQQLMDPSCHVLRSSNCFSLAIINGPDAITFDQFTVNSTPICQFPILIRALDNAHELRHSVTRPKLGDRSKTRTFSYSSSELAKNLVARGIFLFLYSPKSKRKSRCEICTRSIICLIWKEKVRTEVGVWFANAVATEIIGIAFISRKTFIEAIDSRKEDRKRLTAV